MGSSACAVFVLSWSLLIHTHCTHCALLKSCCQGKNYKLKYSLRGRTAKTILLQKFLNHFQTELNLKWKTNLSLYYYPDVIFPKLQIWIISPNFPAILICRPYWTQLVCRFSRSGKSSGKANAWHLYPLESIVTHLLLYFLSFRSLPLLVCSWTSILPSFMGTWGGPTTSLPLPPLSLESLVSFSCFNSHHSHLLTVDLGQILIKSTERFSLEF